jgi:yecA family protein
MKQLPSSPLTDSELDFLDETLLKYGNDDSILGLSELDGFLTAIVSGPDVVMPSRWLTAMWGGVDNQPEWESEQAIEQFMSLVIRHMNSIATVLMDFPEDFEALFNINAQSEDTILIAEEWCFGYMRGVDLGQWPELPDEMDTWLEAIRLHGQEENFAVLKTLTLEEHQQTVAEIEPAVRRLHAYWLARRSPTASTSPSPIRAAPKTGRNAPCP